jgi:hypothetical protein
MREETANRDVAVARIAARQHGIITHSQLIAVGVPRSAISRRLAAGRLHRRHRGVYAVGHRALGNEGRWLAAVLACGEGAVLSHRSAAELWRLLDPKPGPVHVTLPTNAGRRQRNGLRIHRSPHLPNTATTRHRIALPEVNVRIGPFTVDFLWRSQGLVVETDGYAAHRGRQAFEDDRARDAELAAHGHRVLRLTQHQLANEPNRIAKLLRTLLIASTGWCAGS